MGGKSKSSQTSTSNTDYLSQAIQGDNEGQLIGGDGNTVNRTTTEVGDDFTGGNRTDVGDDFTGGNRTEIDGDINTGTQFQGDVNTGIQADGDYTQINGNYSVTDGGAFALAGDVVEEGLKANVDVLKQAAETQQKAMEAAQKANENALKFGSDTVDSALSFGNSALNHMSDSQQAAIKQLSDSQQNALSEYSAQAKRYGEELGDMSQATVSAVNAAAKSAIEQNNESNAKSLETVQQLAAQTALGGQTVVAEQAGKMVMYVAAALAVVAVGLIAFAARGKR
jgi:gas vesicle protein